jgi:hypothetical protein
VVAGAGVSDRAVISTLRHLAIFFGEEWLWRAEGALLDSKGFGVGPS